MLHLPSSWYELARSEGDRLVGLKLVRDDEGEPRVVTEPSFGPQHALVTLPEPLSA